MRTGRVGPKRHNESSEVVQIDAKSIPIVNFYPDIDFNDDKSIERYCRTVKSQCRKSGPYKRLMKFLKYDMENGNRCMFLTNVKQERGSKVKIEYHHTGITITDIIWTILLKRNSLNESLHLTAVAEESMRLHYEGAIGLCPLSTTCHKLIHCEGSGLFIPLQDVFFGDLQKFYDEYNEYMNATILKKVEKYLLMSETVENMDDIIPEYMDPHYIYFDIDGIEFPSMEKILSMIEQIDDEEE